MAVFIAASDETSGGNVFSTYHYSGWVMSEPDWSQLFTPAWQERVLDGPPKIPYLHMTEMRSKAWREQWGVTETDADDRLDEAARVIYQMGSMYPVNISVDGSVFEPLYKPHKFNTESGAKKDFKIDFLAFTCYAYGVLASTKKRRPEAEKVDFMVENNKEITKYVHEFYKSLPRSLAHIGASDLIPLLGEFLPVGKDRVPAQAADYLCWHARRAREETLTDERDLRRWNTIADRKGFSLPMPKDLLLDLADAFTKEEQRIEEANRVRNLRQDDGAVDENPTQPSQGEAGRREDGEAKKAEV